MGSGFTQLVFAIGAGLLALGAALWFGRGASLEPPTASVVLERSAETPELVTVHVSGAVAQPGLVQVPEDSRVAEVIVAAGGVLPSGNPSGLNLAAPVVDGQHLIVPYEADGAGFPAGSGDGLVHLNSASAEELTSLPGVGPVLAERIVQYREANGPFRALEDLLDVAGIGEAKLAGLRDVAAP